MFKWIEKHWQKILGISALGNVGFLLILVAIIFGSCGKACGAG